MGPLVLFSLMRLNNSAVSNVVTISPNSVLAVHRKFIARKWTYRKMSLGRPATEGEVRHLVIEC